MSVYCADIFRRKAVEGKRFHILKADLAFTAVVIFEQFRKSFVNVVSVSYTHLDVYKRQVFVNSFKFSVRKKQNVLF